MQQKLHISLNNNFCHDEANRIGTVLNPNPVSTGLKLSYEEEERNSSVTSACENMKSNVPTMLSLGNTVKMEIDRQAEEFSRYIKLQVCMRMSEIIIYCHVYNLKCKSHTIREHLLA